MDKNIQIGNKTYLLTSDDNYLEEMGADFEPHMVQLFRSLVKPDDVVADIGANIGLTSIVFSNLARKVLAFEPSPSTYKILVENLTRAGASNVDAVNIGFGRKPERMQIRVVSKQYNHYSGGFTLPKAFVFK